MTNEAKHTPGPWRTGKISSDTRPYIFAEDDRIIAKAYRHSIHGELPGEANARLIAAAPDMLEALRLHKAWSDSERAGPDYGGQSRDTHPDGERIWRAWWNNQLDLCDRATRATDEALAKAEGRAA